MAIPTSEVRETTTRTGDTVQKTTQVNDSAANEEHTANVADRIIWLIAGIIITILSFRFVLSLLGANRQSGFASLIYSISYPFVAPFFGLFSYDDTVIAGASRFELYTLIAIAVYVVLAWIISRLVNLNRA